MSAREPRWHGDPVPTLNAVETDAKTRIDLDLDHATLLPSPTRAMRALRKKFNVRGPATDSPEIPALQVRDVVALANYVTLALRHDLPTSDRRDTLVIWDKWRRAVLNVRPRVIGAIATRPYADGYGFHYALDVVRDDLETAMRKPGDVARYYCPWANDFFTQDRLYPEAS